MVRLNFKKLFSTMLILMLGQCALAGTMGKEIKQPDTYNGIYIGADIGLLALFQQLSVSFNATAPNLFSGSSAQQSGHFGLTGGGLLGYDYAIQSNLSLGVEGYINGVDTTVAQSQVATVTQYDAASTSLRQNYAWGFRILPGYEFHPGVITHLIFGYSNAQFKITSPQPATGLALYQAITNETFTRNGFQSGIGLTSIAYHNFSLWVDGLFTTYGAHSSPDFAYNNGSVAYTGTFKSVINTFEGDLTLSYKFA